MAEWRDVIGFEGVYAVSSDGDIRRVATGRVLAKNLAGAGYVKADLWKGGKQTQTTVHRVVAEAFHGPSNGREVNHKNGIKQDNRASNLEWCTRSENTSHNYYELGYRVRPVTAIVVATGEIKNYASVCEAIADGFTSARVHDCLAGRRLTHKGHTFKYTTPPRREWVGLTEEERALCIQATADSRDAVELMCAIEARLKDKNA